MQKSVAIIGAGPAGLTAAYLLAKQNIPVTVLEADPQYVGGIARTVVYKGYCFDIGGHRFFSKAKEIEDFWTEILPHDLLQRPRSSRIFYQGKFFSYPLKFFEVLLKLGPIESIYCCLSYLRARIFPISQPRSFADWVCNHFGKRLFSIFFKTYTEKVWGMSCDSISADWAAQRIKGLSLWSAALNALALRPKRHNTIKTLIDTFRYPRKGPGMLWEACADQLQKKGGILKMGIRLIHCTLHNTHWQLEYYDDHQQLHTLTATHVLSSAPLQELVATYLSPEPSQPACLAAKNLKYRDFLIVVLILKDKQQFADNWIYIHDPAVEVARIQNFKSWSEDMVPDPTMCCYGMEYFCFEDDGLWSASDETLIQKAIREITHIGLATASDIVDGCVVRQAKAYPVYDEHYKEQVALIRQEIAQHYPGLQIVGRNGMHKYNNQDHAMMTAMLAVKNILADSTQYDVWQVNQDAEYLEAGKAGDHGRIELRAVPERLKNE